MARITEWFKRAIHYINTHPKQSILASVAAAVLLYAVVFLLPQPMQFSYSGSNCVGRVTVLPQIQSSPDSSKFDIAFENNVNIGSLGLISFKTCVTPTAPPQEGTTIMATAPFGSLVARSHLGVNVPSPPKVNTATLSKPFPASKALTLPISAGDRTFTYALHVADNVAPCQPATKLLQCDVPKLGLKQDEQYKVKLVREFKGRQATELVAMPVRTLKATSVVDGSVQSGQIVYDRPKAVTYSVDKALVSADASLTVVGDTPKNIPVEATVSGKTITIALPNELERETKYELTIKNVEATDGSTLVEPYKTPYEVSGGPKVKSVNVGPTRVDTNAVIIVEFDQPLADAQPLGNFVHFNGGTATITKASPTRVSIALSNLPRCASFGIDIAAGLKSNYDVATSTPWKFSSRTICYSLSTIGTSVKGRAINAYTFGTSGPATLFVGALHGNEVSSSLILQDWINELEANYSRIPANTQVVVVPTVNPDGVAAGSRNNSRNVNLNRNFPTDNWVKDIDDTNGHVDGGGGSAPLSEPEAKALASLSTSLQPRLMLSYHAVGSVVIGDPGGYSSNYAATYANMVSYRNATGQSSDTFDYSITGSYEDWTTQKVGIPSMVIELGSYTYRSFSHHKEAFWAMLQ